MKDYYLIEYRYLGQIFCKSYKKCEKKQEIIWFLEKFINIPNNKDICDIDLILINLDTVLINFTIQCFRKPIFHSCNKCFKEWSKWEIALIFNDNIIGNLYEFKDLVNYFKLEKFNGIL